MISSRIFKKGYEIAILKGLGKATAITLALYLILRLVDLYLRGNIGILFRGSSTGMLFFIEIIFGVVLLMVLLFSKKIKRSTQGIFRSQALVIAGVLLNRLNVLFLTEANQGGSYLPSAGELTITIGILSLGIFLYRLAVVYLPVFSSGEMES